MQNNNNKKKKINQICIQIYLLKKTKHYLPTPQEHDSCLDLKEMKFLSLAEYAILTKTKMKKKKRKPTKIRGKKKLTIV